MTLSFSQFLWNFLSQNLLHLSLVYSVCQSFSFYLKRVKLFLLTFSHLMIFLLSGFLFYFQLLQYRLINLSSFWFTFLACQWRKYFVVFLLLPSFSSLSLFLYFHDPLKLTHEFLYLQTSTSLPRSLQSSSISLYHNEDYQLVFRKLVAFLLTYLVKKLKLFP